MVETGTRFLDRFTIERLLGEGGFAAVWLARDELGARYAIKIQRSDVRADAASRAFAREGARAKAVAHPNLVRIFESGELDGRGFLVMEHVDGVTLEAELDRRCAEGRGVEIGELRRWTRQLSAAIDALHAASLVHRDLKPANIMIHGPERDVKVLDLGLAHDAELPAEDLTTLGRVKGTTAYMSPEQAHGERVGPPSDVFALTTIVFELLTGLRPWLVNQTGGMLQVGQRVPVRPNDRLTVLRRLTEGRRPLPSVLAAGLPPVLDHVFAAGWAAEPSRRPVPTSAWAARLDAAFASIPGATSAWLVPRRNEPPSMILARAPLATALHSLTPVAETRAVSDGDTALMPIEVTAPARAMGPPPAPAPAPARGVGAPAAAIAAAMVLAAGAWWAGQREEVATIADIAAATASSTAAVGARARVAPVGLDPPTLAPEGAAPAERPSADAAGATAGPAEEPPARAARPEANEAPSPPPRDRRGRTAKARAAAVPAASPTAPPARADAEPESTAAAARRLRTRLERGAPLDEIARAIRERSASADPETRRAIDRWTTSALELGDPRPLALALDALERSR